MLLLLLFLLLPALPCLLPQWVLMHPPSAVRLLHAVQCCWVKLLLLLPRGAPHPHSCCPCCFCRLAAAAALQWTQRGSALALCPLLAAAGCGGRQAKARCCCYGWPGSGRLPGTIPLRTAAVRGLLLGRLMQLLALLCLLRVRRFGMGKLGMRAPVVQDTWQLVTPLRLLPRLAVPLPWAPSSWLPGW